MPLSRLFLLAAALILSGCGSENHVAPEIVEANFHIPCGVLDIEESVWNNDLNILLIKLKCSPPSAFFSSLVDKGWKHHQSSDEDYYWCDAGGRRSVLTHHAADNVLFMDASARVQKK